MIFPTIVSNQLWIVLNLLLTLQLSKSNCEFTPLAATHFLVNKMKEFGVRSGYKFLSDAFKHSYYLFAG